MKGTPFEGLFHRVLFALEPAERNERVWTVVGALVREYPGSLVCHVVMRSTSLAGNELDGNPANPEELAINQALRTALVEHLGPSARELPIKILHGDPGQRICEYAVHEGCDLVMLGSRAKPSLGKMLQGSVSKYVAGNFRGSVLLVGG
jgi:nucleotide-binding universal stress UspA family protein